MVNHPNRELTPALRKMLQRISDGSKDGKTVLELLITASGGREPSKLQTLLRQGWAERCDHHHVKHGGYPADAVRITEAGRAALARVVRHG